MANTNITIRDRRASNGAGPFEIYAPNISSGTRVGETSYTTSQMRDGITLSVPDTTTSIEIRSLGARCGQNKILPVEIQTIADVVEVDPVGSSASPSVVIQGPRRVDLSTSVQLRADVYDSDTPLADQTFLWSTGETTQTITVSSAVIATTTYSVTVTDPEGNTDTDSHTVEFADLSDSDVIIQPEGPVIEALSAQQGNGGRFRVNWGDSSAASVNARISATALYPPSNGFSATINEEISLDRTQYTFDIHPGDSVPNSYNLQINVTIDSNTGDDQEAVTITYVIAAPEPVEDPDPPRDTTPDVCEGNPITRYISGFQNGPGDFCNGGALNEITYSVTTPVKVRNNNPVPDFQICFNGQVFNGRNRYYISTSIPDSRVNPNGALYWQVSENGYVIDAGQIDCRRSGGGGDEGGGLTFEQDIAF